MGVNRYQVDEVVGFRGLFDHCFGRVVLGYVRDDGRWWYLIDESPHNISKEHGSFLVANATLYGVMKAVADGECVDTSGCREVGGKLVGSGVAFSCGWWPEGKLKRRRRRGVVCVCDFCKRARRSGRM